MLMKTLISLTILVMSVISCYSQITINNVVLPAEITYDGNSMVLNGGGIRTKLIFKLYTGGLYLAEKNDNAEAIIKADEPMTVRLAITSNKINSNNYGRVKLIINAFIFHLPLIGRIEIWSEDRVYTQLFFRPGSSEIITASKFSITSPCFDFITAPKCKSRI